MLNKVFVCPFSIVYIMMAEGVSWYRGRLQESGYGGSSGARFSRDLHILREYWYETQVAVIKCDLASLVYKSIYLPTYYLSCL